MKLPRVISIVGRSGAGKTTLLEKIVRELARRGYRVGTVKHDTHGFEIDYPGKDSYRHFHAGADTTIILGPDKMAMVKRIHQPLSLDRVIRDFYSSKTVLGLDIVITEGFKRESKTRIEVVRKALSSEPISQPGEKVVAFVTNAKLPHSSIPQFGLNDVKKIVAFLLRLLDQRELQPSIPGSNSLRSNCRSIERKFICQAKRKK